MEVTVDMTFVGVDIDGNTGRGNGGYGFELGHSKSQVAVGNPMLQKLPTLVALGLGTEQENEARKRSLKYTSSPERADSNRSMPRVVAE